MEAQQSSQPGSSTVQNRAQNPGRTAPITQEQSLPKLINSVEGPDLFRVYCAPCHGLDAKGGGPAAPALKAKPPDLTLLSQKNSGMFPAARVRETINGQKVETSHGSREMPIWGPIFHQVEADTDWGNVRMENLIKFLESIQVNTKVSGAELYKQFCSSCHGSDLKGGAPAPEPYRAPPDLTTLAMRHGGRFPDAYVKGILKNGATIPAHGLADMPAWGSDSSFRKSFDSAEVALRIDNLTDYIRSMQQRRAAKD